MTHTIIDSIIEEFEEYLDIDTFTTIINKKCETLEASFFAKQKAFIVDKIDIFECYEEYRHRRHMYELELARIDLLEYHSFV